MYIDRLLHLQFHAALARALINLSVLLCSMASYETSYGGSIAVKRSINGFDVNWAGEGCIDVRRDLRHIAADARCDLAKLALLIGGRLVKVETRR